MSAVSHSQVYPAVFLQSVLDELEVPHRWPAGSPERGVYCSRTLNLRSIKAIGYDMDYTLIHYDVNAWEVSSRVHCTGRHCNSLLAVQAGQ